MDTGGDGTSGDAASGAGAWGVYILAGVIPSGGVGRVEGVGR